MAGTECLLLLTILFVPCVSWDMDDLELFDLIEEVNKNFYEVFGVDQSAASPEIRKAYRRLSLQYHPDKNDADDAAEKFRQIVAIYEVLKDEKKRERYNQVLVEGLPDWRQPVYYYRRARKMGIYELGIVLSIIITVGQYFVAWAVYVEKRLVLEEVLSSKKKKEKKKKKSVDDGSSEDTKLNSIPTPQVLDLWPFRLSVFIFNSVHDMPQTLRHWQEERKRRKEEEEEQRVRDIEDEEETEEFTRKPKKRTQTQLPEYTSEMYAKFSALSESRKDAQIPEPDRKEVTAAKTGEWTDEELVLLSKAVNKFPGGCHQRWEKIADMVGRSVNEVIAKTKETKGNYSMHLSASVQSSGFTSKQPNTIKISDNIITNNAPDLIEDNIAGSDDNSHIRKRHRPTKVNKTVERTLLISQGGPPPLRSSTETVAGASKSNMSSHADTTDVIDLSSMEPWTQNQQTIFEWALKQYPKGTDQRWELVAQHIPGKTKEDCVARFKLLAELISKKKKAELQNLKPS